MFVLQKYLDKIKKTPIIIKQIVYLLEDSFLRISHSFMKEKSQAKYFKVKFTHYFLLLSFRTDLESSLLSSSKSLPLYEHKKKKNDNK